MDSRTTAADEARAQHARIEERVAERRDGTAHPDTSTPDEEMLAAGTLPLSESTDPSMLEFLRQVASTLKLKGLTATTTWTWANVKEMAGDEESREKLLLALKVAREASKEEQDALTEAAFFGGWCRQGRRLPAKTFPEKLNKKRKKTPTRKQKTKIQWFGGFTDLKQQNNDEIQWLHKL